MGSRFLLFSQHVAMLELQLRLSFGWEQCSRSTIRSLALSIILAWWVQWHGWDV
uniref:Uncharacterized protein n=1 Tax=Arundo donax TaxID=35708 RepID=A0A0A9ATA4_ARUDO